MSQGYLFVALAYLMLAVAVCLFEVRRTRGTGVDTISLFLFLFVLQCCAAGVVIYALLPYVDSDGATGVPPFDRILREADLPTALFVFCLTVWFTIFFYVGCALGRAILPALLPQRLPAWHRHGTMVMTVYGRRLFAILAVGMAVTLYSFYQMGDDLLSRYIQLVLFRAFDEDIERNALNANAFALTQTWSWLTLLAIACVWRSRGWRWLLPICLVAAVVFALLGVSRRALFLPVLMFYLTLVLSTSRWRLAWILAGAVPLALVLAFGKNAISAVAYGGTVETVIGTYESWTSALLRAAADAGITIVESLGTVQFVNVDLRLGMDHLLSMVQMFPEKTLGLDFEFPERVVRISTEAFANPDWQDIPPGLFGQMWLDFGVLGPVIWGLAFGLQISVVQFFFERTQRTLQSAALFVLLVFVLALPLNSGSFDFTFSIDIIVLAMALLLCVRFRQRHVAAFPRSRVVLRS